MIDNGGFNSQKSGLRRHSGCIASLSLSLSMNRILFHGRITNTSSLSSLPNELFDSRGMMLVLEITITKNS
jgi:hypothetical protein